MKTLALIALLLGNVSAFAADAARGEQLYTQKCITCHGADGYGIKAEEAPRIAGQFDWYIVSSLEKFMSGERKNDKMMPFIKGLSSTDFKDLAAYVSKMK